MRPNSSEDQSALDFNPDSIKIFVSNPQKIKNNTIQILNNRQKSKQKIFVSSSQSFFHTTFNTKYLYTHTKRESHFCDRLKHTNEPALVRRRTAAKIQIKFKTMNALRRRTNGRNRKLCRAREWLMALYGCNALARSRNGYL